MLISNLETILTEDLDLKLSQNVSNKHQQKINKAVSFNVIRDRAFEILSSENDVEDILPEITNLMLLNTTSIRKNRLQKDRDKNTKRGRDPKIHFHRNVAKMNF